MIALRILALGAASLLVYALYLPSAYPPQRFLLQIRLSHERNVAFWGEPRADRILQRALWLDARRADLAPAAFATPDPPRPGTDTASAQQMAAVVQRLFHNSYAQGFDALALLAALRLSVLWQWLPWLTGFVGIACIDGGMVRITRSREFVPHSPTRFALCAIGAALVLGVMLLLLIVPADIGPLTLGCAPLLLGALLALAISHVHR